MIASGVEAELVPAHVTWPNLSNKTRCNPRKKLISFEDDRVGRPSMCMILIVIIRDADVLYI